MKLNVSLSARNQIPGTLKDIKKGQTTSHLKIDIGGHIVTASITNEAVDDLQLKIGDSVWAIIKASDVMVAK
jgi:molybdopterin-binding protein